MTAAAGAALDAELFVSDGSDEMEEGDLARLHDAIRRGREQIERGETVPWSDVLAELSAGEGG